MGIEQVTSQYMTARLISLLILAAGMAAALFFYFRYDIRTIYGIRSGQLRKKTVRKMRYQNQAGPRMGTADAFRETPQREKKSAGRNPDETELISEESGRNPGGTELISGKAWRHLDETELISEDTMR